MDKLLEYMEENGIVELYHDYVECSECTGISPLDYYPFVEIIRDAICKWRTLLERAELEVEDTNETPNLQCEISREGDKMVGIQMNFEEDGEISFQIIYLD